MTLRIGLVQFNPVLGDVGRNLKSHIEEVRRAQQVGVDLLVFPELSLTGYHLRDLVPEVALSREDESIGQIASASQEIATVFGFVEERQDYRFQVASAFCDEGRLQHVHRKVYLPTYGMFDEERYLTRGDQLRAFSTRFGRLGLLICEDIWHPSAPYVLALDGAILLIVVANSPGRGVIGGELDTAVAYRNLNQAYARLFSTYVVFVNRVGCEEGVTFWGGSMVVDPFGQIIFEAPLLEEGRFDVEVDLRAVRRARAASPVLQDERLDLTLHELERIRHERYSDLEETD